MTTIEIIPDFLIGYSSIGELGCAYANGCLTAEETLKVAYYYGLAIVNSKIPLGAMAIVGLGSSQIKHILPENVEIASNNSQDSCTISGLKDSVERFITQLKLKDIPTQLLDVLNTPYNSKFIEKAIPSLLENLKKVITNPKLRTGKWISTSVSEDQWGSDVGKHCSAEYCVNNLLNTVLFGESFEHVPKGSVLIELAPHGILQEILYKSTKKNITYIDLSSRNHEDGLNYLLSALGK